MACPVGVLQFRFFCQNIGGQAAVGGGSSPAWSFGRLVTRSAKRRHAIHLSSTPRGSRSMKEGSHKVVCKQKVAPTEWARPFSASPEFEQE
jgi:hypothetical protein